MFSIAEEMKGKVVIVTGGNKGIGKGCAEVFCDVGANVVICGRNVRDGEDTCVEINAKGGGHCDFYRCDVSVEAEIIDLVRFTTDKYGRLDCMINNAAYHPPEKRIDDVPLVEVEDVLRNNFLSVFSGCKYALPHLRKTKGSIINVSSVLQVTGTESVYAYVAAKGAIGSFTKSLAIDEAQHGVRVNALLPGNILTDIYYDNLSREDNPQEFEDYSNHVQWMGRGGQPKEMGMACLFLASSMSSFVTGISLLASGGFEIGEGAKYYRMPWNK